MQRLRWIARIDPRVLAVLVVERRLELFLQPIAKGLIAVARRVKVLELRGMPRPVADLLTQFPRGGTNPGSPWD